MRPTRAVVDLTQIRHNVRVLRNCTANAAQQFMAVVKANAYGHGAVPVARATVEAGATWLAVATVTEGAELRDAGLLEPILVLAPAADPEDVDLALAKRLSLTVCSQQGVDAVAQRARPEAPAAVHVKVDTGMGRLGVSGEHATEFIVRVDESPALLLEGVFSHFASADEMDLGFARLQLQRFQEVLGGIAARGIRIPLRHMANTAATMVLPESHLDLVRTGIGIYGLYPSPEVPRTVDLHPALRWETAISHLKTVPANTPLSYGCTFRTRTASRIATLPVGYADGYPRLLSNRGQVLVRGRLAPVVGRVCMDMILVDVTGIPEATAGDPVTLIGRDGDREVSADDLARWCGTINYEITCAIGGRVPRSYVGRLTVR